MDPRTNIMIMHHAEIFECADVWATSILLSLMRLFSRIERIRALGKIGIQRGLCRLAFRFAAVGLSASLLIRRKLAAGGIGDMH